jgi:protein gp37
MKYTMTTTENAGMCNKVNSIDRVCVSVSLRVVVFLPLLHSAAAAELSVLRLASLGPEDEGTTLPVLGPETS